MINKNLLGIEIKNESKKDILEKIKKFIIDPGEFMHIVSLNPENLVVAQENVEFRKVLSDAPIKLIDGVGIVLAAKLKGIEVGERVTGVDMMKELVELADEMRLRVLLIGGKADLANNLAKCYSQSYKNGVFKGIIGIKDIENPKKEEFDNIFSIVADYKPHIVLAAFGSPAQELWFWKNRTRFKAMICVGVGGAFDYHSGAILRAPKLIRDLGLEWLFRLIREPWRIRRQITRLPRFIYLVVKN